MADNKRQCPVLPSLRPVTSTPYSPHVDLDTSIDFIQGEMHKCSQEHDDCTMTPDPPLPKRVIAIDQPSLRLVEPEGLVGRYATLSHCWGGFQPLKTTQENLADMLAAIPEDRLPVVFTEAILLARRLGIPYLWIDSLCIIQGSQEDWEVESAKMCDYYSNGWLNIAAGSSSNHSVSLLRVRDPCWSPVTLSLAGFDFLARRIPAPADRSHEGPLFSRAWAWQESALARRTMSFTNNNLVWACREGVSQHTYDGTEHAFHTARKLYRGLDPKGKQGRFPSSSAVIGLPAQTPL